MDKNDSEKVTAASLHSDILVSIFKFLTPNSRGKAARVCSSWKEAANCKSIWQNIEIRLRTGIPNEHSERSIFNRGVKRFDVCRFQPRVYEFLLRNPDLEYLRSTGSCLKRKLLDIFKTVSNWAEILDPGLEIDSRNSAPLIKIADRICQRFRPFQINNFDSHNCQHNPINALKTLTSGMTKLKELRLEGCVHYSGYVSNVKSDYITGKDIEEEEKSPFIQKLHLKDIDCLDKGTFEYITNKFVNLVSLSLECCGIIADGGLDYLIHLKKLEILRVADNFRITGILSNHISQILNLKSLEIAISETITDGDLQSISRLQNLTNLDLDFDYMDRFPPFSAAAWRHLNEMPHLRELGLKRCQISTRGLSYLAEGSLKLTKLSLAHCFNVRDEGLLNICQSSFVLNTFNLMFCNNVTDYGIRCVVEKFPGAKVNVEFRPKDRVEYMDRVDELSRIKNANLSVTNITYDSRITSADSISDRMVYWVKHNL